MLAIDLFNNWHLTVCHHDWFGDPIYISNNGGQGWILMQYNRQPTVPRWPGYWWSANAFSLTFDPHHQNRVYYTDWYGIWHIDNITASPSVWTTSEPGHEEIAVFALKSLPVRRCSAVWPTWAAAVTRRSR